MHRLTVYMACSEMCLPATHLNPLIDQEGLAVSPPGRSFADCIEKSDLRQRAREASAAGPRAGLLSNLGGRRGLHPAPLATSRLHRIPTR
jgi:hypothetical protein